MFKSDTVSINDNIVCTKMAIGLIYNHSLSLVCLYIAVGVNLKLRSVNDRRMRSAANVIYSIDAIAVVTVYRIWYFERVTATFSIG